MKRFLLLVVGLIFSGLALAAVNINTATKEELEALNGIGPVKAQAIIDYRKANGPFKSIDDVKNVKGVGDATFDKIRGDLSLSGATKLPAGAAAPAKAEPAKAAAAPAAAPAPAKAEPAKAAAAAPAAASAKDDKAAKEKSAKEEKAAKDKAAKDEKAAKDKAAKDEKAAKAAKDKAAKDEKAAKDKAAKDAKAAKPADAKAKEDKPAK
ncbi:MAG TPA: helix-hairpin-helix domain-containing protein [Casimicrobiaceae bacterium]|nr:helix-hairpin-helix domain-containing protein [Casimicrobiaceae bacterium]